MYDKGFLGVPPLSEEQTRLVESMTYIYNEDTVESVWGKDKAKELKGLRVSEIIAQLGKGSGKDYCTSIAFARVIYLLLCLKDPAAYYGKPSGDQIDLLNVAINAKQAKNVFFSPLKKRIQKCPWFKGKHDTPRADFISFDKNITAHSGHSEREAWEGYNFIMVVLDEIAGFATDAETSGDNRVRGKTAESIYKMYRASVSSRFPKHGKLVLLSFPRYKGDFIQKRYDEVVAEKEIVIKSHPFKIHDDVPDGVAENEFDIDWEEDHIVSYSEPNVYAIRRPSWYVNPLLEIDDFKMDFYKDLEDSLARFACMPPEAIDAFFKDRAKIEKAFPDDIRPPFTDGWRFKDRFVPEDEKDYYAHVDLAYTHDRAAVAMAHVDSWVKLDYGGKFEHHEPLVVVDAVRWWTPRKDRNVDLSEIEEYIMSLKRRGFRLKLVTFDRWQSVSTIQQLKSAKINADTLSVAKPHYEELAIAISEERVKGYDMELLRDELLGLRIIRGNKVDHPRKGSKDLADAVCGAVYNAIKRARRSETKKIEVRYLEPGAPSKERNKVEDEKPKERPPMPKELAEFMDRVKLL